VSRLMITSVWSYSSN